MTPENVRSSSRWNSSVALSVTLPGRLPPAPRMIEPSLLLGVPPREYGGVVPRGAGGGRGPAGPRERGDGQRKAVEIQRAAVDHDRRVCGDDIGCARQ